MNGFSTGFEEATAASDAEAATSAPPSLTGALYQSVVQYELASRNTQEEYTVIAAAVLAAKEGRNASQIIANNRRDASGSRDTAS